MINLYNSLLVIIGSAIGGGCRFWISTWMQKQLTTSFPIGTFTVNMLGCFAIGLIVGMAEKSSMNQTNLTLLLASGFCGGFTTFSAFALENIQLLKNGLNVQSATYIIVSVAVGVALVKTGMTLIK
ncbi:putative fluoride ion transporter CrcB [Bacteroidota bacterium]|nr:putative fluoride ion transporter CrcB [Bacteroidota bacterium]